MHGKPDYTCSMPLNTVKPAQSSEVDEDFCQMPVDDSTMIDNIPCFKIYHDTLGFKMLVFVIVFCLDIFDFIGNWFLYCAVSQTEGGLVYGPVDDATRYSLLAFSIVGSFILPLEIINLYFETFYRKLWIDTELLSAVIIWVEDFPQIVISVYLFACRENAISYLQLFKASAIVFGVVVRVVLSLIKCFGKRARRDVQCVAENEESCKHVTLRGFIIVGLAINLVGAIAVFLFTHFERNSDGSLNFKALRTLLDDEWDNGKYFKNVSIYFSHPVFDQDHTGVLEESKVNWIRLSSVPMIRNSPTDTVISVTYEHVTSTQIKMKISGGAVTDCFVYDRNQTLLTNTASNICNSISTTVSTFKFQFHYINAQQPSLIFGDISYNVNIQSNGKCSEPDNGIFESIGSRLEHVETEKRAAVQYFQTKDEVSDEYHVLHQQPNWQFFHTAGLTDITDVWKVGFLSCKSSGSLAPHRDRGISITCTC